MQCLYHKTDFPPNNAHVTQELALVWTSITTGDARLISQQKFSFISYACTPGTIISADYPGSGVGIWTPVNRAASRLEVLYIFFCR